MDRHGLAGNKKMQVGTLRLLLDYFRQKGKKEKKKKDSDSRRERKEQKNETKQSETNRETGRHEEKKTNLDIQPATSSVIRSNKADDAIQPSSGAWYPWFVLQT